MEETRAILIAEFRRRLVWIAVGAVVVAVVALSLFALSGPITWRLALAVAFGSFFTFALGGGLFAASFFSARGGFDEDAADVAESMIQPPDPPTGP
ncbi:MAG TPA: hypothetical protein VMW18_01895 [Candidatus Binatia bacterium]|nr:hypothetical protein [Candidatus Binatia bacterium]